MKRGTLVTIALQGEHGKPRPALVIQSDFFAAHPTVTVLPVTSDLRKTPLFRVDVAPSAGNGLRKASQIMVDKAVTVAHGKLGVAIGILDTGTMQEIERRLAVFLGIAK